MADSKGSKDTQKKDKSLPVQSPEEYIRRRLKEIGDKFNERLRDIEARCNRFDETREGLIKNALEIAEKYALQYMKGSKSKSIFTEALLPDYLGIIRFAKSLVSLKGLREVMKKFRMMGRSDVVDEFGMDPVFVELVEPLFLWLYEKYWRVETFGLKNVPASGRALIVANHSGLLPYDGAMIYIACMHFHPAHRMVRFLAEDMFSNFPVIAPIFTRGGMIRACQENAERLLNKDLLVGVFPEGVKGIGKYYKERYRLQRFGRGGVIRLIMKTRAPLIPAAVVGAEEIHPVIAKSPRLARLIGIPFFPITPTWPILGPLGLLPLPSKWFIEFGEVLNWAQEYDPEDVLDDDLLINRLNEQLRANIQERIYQLLKKRNSVWF